MGRKLHEVPAHHKLEEFLDAYVGAVGLKGQKKAPLFRTTKGNTKALTARGSVGQDAHITFSVG